MNQNDNCPIATTLDVIGGKWKVHILCVLMDGKMRTNEIRREIPNITQKVLTQQLRQLEADGIIHRAVYQEVPPKVEYTISDYGKSLIQIMDELCEWGKDHQIKKLHD
ncbi:helix-turn-helix domain-containing protein [Bacillus cereus]|uniref:winged helix-turn-helix transcriptional regulator n=1 Tax=Bacillus TaxID=1386 RepID=UPI000B43950A|nr:MULTISPECIES: helix-turn-helix domain-containing protein [Bacillus]MDA1904969.1 helix-turn-helix domain-containing protein [Bacillus cereus]MDA2165097.1 helix-turn-helix domain-containing protein [Bacillus cereus]MDQ7235481.1 helix-turn-helix domain-containing protein [Bacillus pacificus]MDQ7240019.1 helix-turn-helix domain-containing protein [Bacillus pacificus]MED1304008.1 helix-turn-helix domain-containing protein [Bacillus pacificus]